MPARRDFDSSAERYFTGAGFSGVVLLAEDPRFERARRVWNGMIDRTPALIACCRDTLDVKTAIGFARETGRALSVRCGGHNVAGTAVADGAVMIDLSFMRAVVVDPGARIAVVACYATWTLPPPRTALPAPPGCSPSPGLAGWRWAEGMAGGAGSSA